MVPLFELQRYCDELLDVGRFQDYCPNGVQVEAGDSVRRLVSGVTACQALIEEAIRADADALLVHHGYFWKGEPPALIGMKGRRIRRLMGAGISLLAYHLPLDAHPVLGNNRCLGERLEIVDPRPVDGHQGLFWQGRLARSLSAERLGAWIAERLDRHPLYLAGNERPIETIGWCTGAGQGSIVEAAAMGLDAYLTGEASEQTLHQSRELGVHFFAAGHHATERDGVRALGDELVQRYGIDHRFVDIPNPV